MRKSDNQQLGEYVASVAILVKPFDYTKSLGFALLIP
jgi:hypothetical protein